MTEAVIDSQLQLQIDKLKEYVEAKFSALREVIDERDRLYLERSAAAKVAVDAALAAQKEMTASSFMSSEKAIVKAEESQKAYNAGHNDLSRKMEQQYTLMVPQSEARLKWESTERDISELRKENGALREILPREIAALRSELMKEIAGLRESRSESSGKNVVTDRTIESERNQRNTNTTTIIAIVVGFVGVASLIVAIVALFAKGHG